MTLGQILKHIEPIRGGEADSVVLNPDFTIIVTWAKFLGEYNYRLFDLAGAVKEDKKSRIRLIWLNIDIQKSWHITDRQKIRIM